MDHSCQCVWRCSGLPQRDLATSVPSHVARGGISGMHNQTDSTDDQLGNMVASASAQIEAVAGERLVDAKTGLPAYGKVSAILIGVSPTTVT
jgi:hypothetical protein